DPSTPTPSPSTQFSKVLPGVHIIHHEHGLHYGVLSLEEDSNLIGMSFKTVGDGAEYQIVFNHNELESLTKGGTGAVAALFKTRTVWGPSKRARTLTLNYRDGNRVELVF